MRRTACEYGCGRKASFILKNGKLCCDSIPTKCPAVRQRNAKSLIERFKDPEKHPMYGKRHSDETLDKMRKIKVGKILTFEHKDKIRQTLIGQMAGEKNPMYGVKGERHPWYGKCHTEETKLKISNSKRGKGKPLTDSHKEKIRQSMIGRVYPDEWKEKLRLIHTGMKASDETRKKLSLMRSGNKHPNWKGGISCEPYCDAWADWEYKESIKERDSYQCQNPDCWHTCNRLGIHHINYNKKDCSPDNLITLCQSCNGRANFNREYWQELFNGILLTINSKKLANRRI